MIRLSAAALLVVSLSGCGGVPATVVWTTVGAGLGAGAQALHLADDVVEKTPAEPAQR